MPALDVAKRVIKFVFRLTCGSGGWINFLPWIAMLLYTVVTLGCLNKMPIFINLYLVSFEPSQSHELRIGYFGLCVKSLTKTNGQWLCSRFIDNIDQDIKNLVDPVKALQKNAMFAIPALAAALLFVCWVFFLIVRNRASGWVKRGVVGLLWISCVIGFASALLPMALTRALHYVGPIYGSKVNMGINMGSVILTWIAFGFHIAYVVLAIWWDKHVGGVGGYGLGV